MTRIDKMISQKRPHERQFFSILPFARSFQDLLLPVFLNLAGMLLTPGIIVNANQQDIPFIIFQCLSYAIKPLQAACQNCQNFAIIIEPPRFSYKLNAFCLCIC